MQEKGKSVTSIIKSVFTALITTLLGILIFALIISLTGLGGVVIKSVNQFIKVLSIFLGCSFFIRSSGGLIKGAIVGVVYSALMLALFSLFGAGEMVGKNFYIELIFGGIIGAISGIMSVNVKRRA